MRADPTPPERALWRALSARKLDGLKFRRQAVLDGFIVDFYGPEAKLVIELDGQTHTDPARDARRDATLFATRGLRVLRFSNQHVGEDLDGVLRAILAAARGAPSPNPSLRGRGANSSPLLLRKGPGEGSPDTPNP
jgi:very-short-patch-repair endonuclease